MDSGQLWINEYLAMDSGGQFISCINEYLAMDSGGQFMSQLYK